MENDKTILMFTTWLLNIMWESSSQGLSIDESWDKNFR